MEFPAEFPRKLQFLEQPHRYKVLYGGRGGAKSWGIARQLLVQGAKRRLRILCARETQKSITDSVHTLLKDQITKLGLSSVYTVTNHAITASNGTNFAFIGIRQNVSNMKSFEGCDICWVEEAQTVSKHSWEVLIPTIRKEGSEIWISFNPELETDETYKRFITNPPPQAAVHKVNWSDNPWFPDVLKREAEHLKAKDPDAYQHVYEGMCKQTVEGAIYKQELTACEKEGRITRVPYEPTQPVHTFWDLGFGDNTAIWFAQSIGFEFRLIDFFSGCQEGLQYYLKALQDRHYVYGRHYLPHDACSPMLAVGRTIQEQLGAIFPGKVEIVPKLSISDGLAAARAIFPKCWFDAENCADGLQALRHYRYEFDDRLGSLKKEPFHDWASHPADAFRYFAVAINEQRPKPKPREVTEYRYPGQQAQTWMG